MTEVTHPGADELRADFERELASVTTGGGLHPGSALDVQTSAALIRIAETYPEVDGALIAAARAAFTGQLDGSNAEARLETIAEQIEEH
ncbi:hypothetical protein [Nocardia asteroides]|uniref:hypothetical protein n=1 Tax=Nocardia asteroides TaxID=1824 RepID=UPI001E28D234|nr:hypothetical protein [Nocardia asteroides]UGT63979.1 hypothetical protein LTT61_12015 [Nocardia asteroides]